MEVRSLTQERLQINSKNIIGWLKLLLVILDLDDELRFKAEAFINRKDKARRQNEIDKLWG